MERSDDSTVLNVAVLKQTKVDVVLHQPTRVELPDGTEEMTAVRFYVDNPRAFVATARERLVDRRTVEPTTSSR